jgi:hypothetical protein
VPARVAGESKEEIRMQYTQLSRLFLTLALVCSGGPRPASGGDFMLVLPPVPVGEWVERGPVATPADRPMPASHPPEFGIFAEREMVLRIGSENRGIPGAPLVSLPITESTGQGPESGPDPLSDGTGEAESEVDPGDAVAGELATDAAGEP